MLVGCPWFIMAVSGAEMLGAASFSRRAGIPSSPVPFDVLSSLSWRWTNAADTGFKESKDWLELFKHASVLSWSQLRGGIPKSNFSTTFVKYVQKPSAIVRASVVVLPSTVIGSIEADGWGVTDLLGRTFFQEFLESCYNSQKFLGSPEFSSMILRLQLDFAFRIIAVTWFLKLLYLDQCNSVFVLRAWR